MQIQRILIAVDDSTIAEQAVDVGLQLADVLKAQSALVHVIEPYVSYGADVGIPNGELAQLQDEDAQKLFDKIRRQKSLPPSVHEFTEIGSAAPGIVRAAKEWRADLIVIGSHGRRGFSHVMLGSVAEAVMRRANCPVLVVRMPT